MSLLSVHKYTLTIGLLACTLLSYGFTPTGVAPAFFGPNAFPVPDMSDGQTSSQLRIELAADGYFSYEKSRTVDFFARLRLPLFTRWANLAVWMPVYEWYSQADGTGSGVGDVYLTTDIQILHNEWFRSGNTQYIPQMTIRAGVKTASGEQFNRARHYDCPGYFFDLTMGQTIPIKKIHLNLAGTVGFLCWQTANARQNDAVMYGIRAKLVHPYFSFLAEWGGYVGWERYGDAPMVIKLRATGIIKGLEPFVQYQYGINDYPFHQVRVGLAYSFNILKSQNEK